MRPRLLDLFCGAGGAAVGYHRAGFEVVGVDIAPQPRFPFAFVQADALAFLAEHGHEFDAIHASPPCQAFSAAQTIRGRVHPDLLTPCRELLIAIGRPAVIENVIGAPMRADVTLCGTLFGLGVPAKRGYLERHRAFEFACFPVPLILRPACNHPPEYRAVGVYGHTGTSATFDRTKRGSGNHGWLVADWREAMGIDWMTRDELAQAIPPAYTEFIGGFLRDA